MSQNNPNFIKDSTITECKCGSYLTIQQAYGIEHDDKVNISSRICNSITAFDKIGDENDSNIICCSLKYSSLTNNSANQYI